MSTAWHALVAVAGALAVLGVADSVVRTFVLPRASMAPLSRLLFGALWVVFAGLARPLRSYERRDKVMALYAPITLVAMPIFWLTLLWLAFTPLLYAAEGRGWVRALTVSGSSLWTLGFERPSGALATGLAFGEAATGLIVVALLIAYVPTIYSNFSSREVMVTQLGIRSDTPPTAWGLLTRAHAAGYLVELDAYFAAWERWYVELQETHTSLAPLIFLRSPRPERSWITAAGAMLDAAAIRMAVVDLPFHPAAGLSIRAGTLALRAVSDLLGVDYDPDPSPEDPITITRQEYDEVVERLRAAGVPLRAADEDAWLRFRGWRVNYDTILVTLAGKLMAPYAPWSSDRSLRTARTRLTVPWRRSRRYTARR